MEEESLLEKLKKDYDKLRKKYNLPAFKELNEAFDIEEVAEQETECLLRQIRKHMMDKVVAYLRFIEMLLNPSNAPMFFFALVKGLTASDKRLLDNLYERLGEFEIDVIALDCKYNEKEEADFINKAVLKWKDITDDMIILSETLKRNWNQKSGKNERGYCG
ncbi:hypothetical protein A3K73_05880 [Candidatus Pacearchaeota archaeon RBG_13_36_9]|nr:MAG: hypothetical protein A3K73_05880 [Candidatus Pacearchaeota archaeon RBG_13_36_9]